MWLITPTANPLAFSTMITQGRTMKSKAAWKSLSRIPTPSLPFPAAVIASLALFIPWCILRSDPMASWQGESVWVATTLSLSLMMPVMILKSELSSEIFLLSLGFTDFGFLGLQAKTMSEVRCERVGCCPAWTAYTTSVRASPTMSQEWW